MLFSQCGIDAYQPKIFEIALFLSAILVSIDAGLGNGGFCLTNKLFTSPFEAFGGFEDISASFDMCLSTFDSRHMIDRLTVKKIIRIFKDE